VQTLPGRCIRRHKILDLPETGLPGNLLADSNPEIFFEFPMS
jgi:hypothetical protein